MFHILTQPVSGNTTNDVIKVIRQRGFGNERGAVKMGT